MYIWLVRFVSVLCIIRLNDESVNFFLALFQQHVNESGIGTTDISPENEDPKRNPFRANADGSIDRTHPLQVGFNVRGNYGLIDIPFPIVFSLTKA